MRSDTMDQKKGPARNTASMTSALIVMGCLVVAVPARGQTTLYTFDGDSVGDNFGRSVSGAGDVNGDGIPDFIVGAVFDDNNGTNSGSVRVFSGADGSILYTFNGDLVGDHFGWSVSGAGDVDCDGYADLIVGAPLADNKGLSSGSARVFSGFNGSILYTFNGDSAGDFFGTSVSGAGDVNGDGVPDLIVGAHLDDGNGDNSGSARVFSGVDGSVLYTFDGDPSDLFGISVSGAGDVDGDGFADFIIGAIGDDTSASNFESARVFSGFDGSILYTFDGDSEFDNFGRSVSGAGDVNADGFDDLIVGAHGDDNNGSLSGSATVFSGADGSILYTFNGDSAEDVFGWSVCGAGDVDGDGFADLIVGAPGDDNNGTNSGSARVFSGFNGSVLYTLEGDSAFGRFGSSVSGAGEVDGDGFADLIVGASNDDNNGTSSGSARVISGRPNALSLLELLIQDVVVLNLSVGIENSLDAKLDAIFLALDDLIDGNDQAAINILQAFITQVEAQSGNQIAVADADALIDAAQAIIDLLLSGG